MSNVVLLLSYSSSSSSILYYFLTVKFEEKIDIIDSSIDNQLVSY
jgi:hypothetical protein